MMGAIAVLQSVSRMPILVLMTPGSTIVRTPTPVKMTGPCRVMRHSVTALRLEMVPATSIVGRRSADGTQINQVYLIVVVKANAVLGEPGFEFVADCNGQCYYGFFFDRWMEMDSAIKESTDFR